MSLIKACTNKIKILYTNIYGWIDSLKDSSVIKLAFKYKFNEPQLKFVS
jgi:hypothetical protein